MSNITGSGAAVSPRATPQFPASLPRTAFDGVRSRRMMAFVVDFCIVSLMLALAAFVLAIPTLGLAPLLMVFALPAIFAIVAFFYNGFSVSGPNMGTPGMRLMDIEMGTSEGNRVPFLNAAVHAVLFYVSWSFPPIFLVSFLSNDKRCLHDMLADVIVTRRTL